MNIKDKIAIGLTIIIVVIFGFILNGRAANVSGSIATNLNVLAQKASTDADWFLGISSNKLYNKKISGGTYYTAVYYRSGMCMYHKQANIGGYTRVVYTL